MILVGNRSVYESAVDGFEFLDEGEVNGQKLMKDHGKDVISVKIGGKEYRYIAKPDREKDITSIFKSFDGMLKHAPSGAGYKALAFLKKHTYCCYGAKNIDDGLKVLEG